MRKFQAFSSFIAACTILVALMFGHAHIKQRTLIPALSNKGALARQLGLTDLCLFTDARYTRHPTMADRHTPFQDYPMSLEHFPSASMLTPPPHLGRASRR